MGGLTWLLRGEAITDQSDELLAIANRDFTGRAVRWEPLDFREATIDFKDAAQCRRLTNALRTRCDAAHRDYGDMTSDWVV